MALEQNFIFLGPLGGMIKYVLLDDINKVECAT